MSSIAIQNISDKAIITIVDDASNIDYKTIIQTFSEIIDINYIRLDENKGVGNARQIGFNSSNCKYVCYVDSDDAFYSEYSLMMLRDKIASNNYDFVTGKFIREFVSNKINPLSHLTLAKIGMNSTWLYARIYSRQFLLENRINFATDMRYNEDAPYISLCLMCSDNNIYMDNTVYVQHCNFNSLTHLAEEKKDILNDKVTFVKGLIIVQKQKRERGIVDNEKAIKQACDFLSVCYWYFIEILNNTTQDKCEIYLETLQKLYNIIKEDYPNIRNDKRLGESYFVTLECLKEITNAYIPSISFFELLDDLESNRNISNACDLGYEFG